MRMHKRMSPHGHDDHAGGLKELFKATTNIELISHPDSFNYKEENEHIVKQVNYEQKDSHKK